MPSLVNDTRKENCGVKSFEDDAIKIIQTEREAALKKVHKFTDGCACQYKGKRASMMCCGGQSHSFVKFLRNKSWKISLRWFGCSREGKLLSCSC